MVKIVQYIFLRTDLKTFGRGSLVAQACHACVKAINVYKDHIDTINYLKAIENMHKVVLKIDSNNMQELKELLDKNHIQFVEWIEQPENIVTSISTRPIDVDCLGLDIKKLFSNFKLY